MVATILIGAVIAVLSAMAANEYVIYKDFPEVSQINILPILFLISALGGLLFLLS
tara:strand:+ start:246 stop:410 length:165 start_codon:yes stop_codon:yes gene_type:complete